MQAAVHMDTFNPQQTRDYYLSLEDAEHLTNRRLPYQLLGRSTTSLEVFEEELKGQPVVVKRFRIDEHHSPSLEEIKTALGKWKQVSSHPNIMPFFGLCAESQSPFPMLITPRVRWSLLQYIEAHPDASKHALAYSIAAALDYMHSQDGLTHGNVKAGNVLVDRDGIAYLSDIGIFQAAISLGPHTLVDELRWSAPEKVLHHAQHTPACDTWSFGMIIIEMHTGSRPFDYYHLERVVIAMTLSELPMRPSNLEDNRLWYLVEKCLRYAAINRPTMEWVSRSLSHIRPLV